ncbi:MAG: LysM peptidoglycan-binding domain-containing protein [Bacillota bacterium]|nr:LysM peptidoglycan-binding domain-containing protein [Bacillota bacterium]MDW7684340.1 LysM peptidoglycan-binding domain-containing protein [Bacillota bacterium]
MRGKRRLLMISILLLSLFSAFVHVVWPVKTIEAPGPVEFTAGTAAAGDTAEAELLLLARMTEPAAKDSETVKTEFADGPNETAGFDGAKPQREPVNGERVRPVSRSGTRLRTQDETKTQTTPAEQPAPAPMSTPESRTLERGVYYITHTIKRGDTFWAVAGRYGIPMPELLEANNLSESSPVNIGMTLQVPQYNIPVKSTPGPQYGELVDWWSEAQYLWPIGTNARITDFATGKSFTARRTFGAFHADVEPLTAEDAQIMREIWGGWSWATRPVIVEVNGRRLAASSNAMPHSVQTIHNNHFDGHFCIHFLNSTRHDNNLPQADHQQNVRTAAGQ